MRKFTYVALSFLVAIAPVSGRAEVAPANPTPVTIVRRFMQAMRTLHACTIVVDTNGSLPGTSSPAYAGSITWQDSQHFVTRITRGPWIGEVYVSGEDRWTYVPALHAYMRGAPSALTAQANNLFAMLPKVSQLGTRQLNDPWVSFIVSTLRVTEATLDGEPVYHLTIGLPEGAHYGDSPIRSVSLVLGRDDSLPRRISVVGDKAYQREMTLRFTASQSPFPLSTFVFTPPSGAVQAMTMKELYPKTAPAPRTPKGPAPGQRR